MKQVNFNKVECYGECYTCDAEGDSSGGYYQAADVDARIKELEQVINTIYEQVYDNPCIDELIEKTFTN